MAKLSQDQLGMYAQSAGLSADRARIAAAVAMAESGGETTAHNSTPPDDSYGPWQINMLGTLGPARRKALGITSNTQLYDPAVNARAMAMISAKGSNFGPWSTYSSGEYKRFLTGSTTEQTIDIGGILGDIGGLTGDVASGTLGEALSGLKGLWSIAEILIGASAWLSKAHNWVRVAQVVLGGAMVGVGVAVMTKGSVAPVAKAATKAAVAIGTDGASLKAGKAATKAAPKSTPKPKPKPEAA